MLHSGQKVYQAIEAYAEAVEEIDELATAYQKNIDEAYQKVEEMYQNYMIAKSALSYEEQQKEFCVSEYGSMCN